MTCASVDDSTTTDRRVTGRVLIVDDHAQARESMIDVLTRAGHDVEGASSAIEALALLESESYDVVITDLQMPGMSGLEFIRAMEQRRHGAQVLMVTAHATISSAVEAMRHGALDYIEKPFNVDQLEKLVARTVVHGNLLDAGPKIAGQTKPAARATMIGSSPAMQTLRKQIAQAAPTPETVLICGESGTGKELVAWAIHAASNRASGPFVGLNCPVLSAQLMESELFGHCRGAFTGAESDRTGRFELAGGGTILLDEVTEIDLGLQAKLLRVLQDRTFERVGSSRTMALDVRVLATTNRDLRRLIADGGFREDLYYRLAVLPLTVPPLRDRREDIPELVAHFLQRAACRLGKDPCSLDRGANDLLLGYHWPGNVRELENIVTRASVLNTGGPIRTAEMHPWLIDSEDGPRDDVSEEMSVGLSLHDMERKLIEATLEHYGGHRAKTAEALGIGIRTLSGKLKTYGYAPRAKTCRKAA